MIESKAITSHELARELLNLPEARVVGSDGCCGVVTFGQVRYFEECPPPEDSPGNAWVHCVNLEGPYVYLDSPRRVK